MRATDEDAKVGFIVTKKLLAFVLALGVTASGAARAVQARQGQQTPPPARGDAGEPLGVTPGEIQRMFEAAALVRAQEALKLGDDKYLPFLAKYKALQDVRRRAQQERQHTIQELRRLVNDPSSDENQIKDRLKTLQDIDARSEAEIRKAQEGVDSVLDVRQQGKFRLFEQQMEMLKVELLTRARQANRQQRKPPS